MITSDLNRVEFTANANANSYIFQNANASVQVKVKEETHILVYVTTTGEFTANSSTNIFTDTAHGHLDTQIITVSAGSSLPTGLLTSTDYFVRDKGNDTFKLALSSGGTAITISNTGSGTLTWTKTLLKVLNTDYSVAISSSNDATVTWLSGKRPVDGDKFFFLRTVPYTQSINLLNNSLIDAESLENQLDLIVNQTQQLNAKTDRDLRFHTNLITTDATASQASLNVTVVNRANKSLKFDALGSLSVTTVNVDDVEDYVLDAKSYATESGAVVNLHTNSTPSAQSGVYSAKEHAVGTPPDGSAKEWATTATNAIAGGLYSAKEYASGSSATGGTSKEWATKTDGAVDTTFSSKEYAQGTTAGTGGSAKNWASQVSADVTGGSSGDKSAKAWALETGNTAPTDGSAKQWATLTTTPSGTATDASAREWAIGTSTHKNDGSAKLYATKVDGAVTGSNFSAQAWAVGGTNVTNTSGRGSAKDWATDVTGPVDTSEFSAKSYASVTGSEAPTVGSAKEWATITGAEIHSSEYSAKEYASGTTAPTGTSKEWATKNDGVVITGEHSAKAHASVVGTHAPSTGSAREWASEVGTNAPSEGSSKEWATTTGAVVASSEFSAKEYATGSTATLGTAKEWALGGGSSFTEGTEVVSNLYSARKYASDASASELAARNSAAAVSATYDNFADVYLGSMADNASADSGALTGASWAKDSSTIAFTGTSGTISVGQELTSTGTGYPVGANIIGSSVSTPLTISNSFTVSGSGATLNFVGSGVYGAFNSSKDGPSTDNDGDALVTGNLYFNTTDNTMKIYDGGNWIAATSAGSASLLEYKFVTTSGQVSNKTYSGTANVGGSMSYTASNTLVYLNGVLLKETVGGTAYDYVAQSGTSIVLTVAPSLNDELTVVAFKSFTVSDTVSAASGGTFSGSVIAGGGLETDTNSKIKQKGAFMQSSTHQALTLGA